MSWLDRETIGSASNKTSGTNNLVINTTAEARDGRVLFVMVASDNVQTTDGESTLITVTDSAGNTYTTAGEATNGNGAAGAGCTVGIYYSHLATTLPAGGTITITTSSAVVAKAATTDQFQVDVGDVVTVERYVMRVDDAVEPGSVQLTPPSAQYLFLLAIAHEGPVEDAFTQASSLIDIPSTGTTGGTAGDNITVRAGWNILTTNDYTVDASYTATDHAQVFAAFKAAPGSGTDWVQGAADTVTVTDVVLAQKVKIVNAAESVTVTDTAAHLATPGSFAMPDNEWVPKTPVDVTTPYGGVYEGRGWNHMRWAEDLGVMVIYDGYVEAPNYPGGNIYANSIWTYNVATNRRTLIKRSNWTRSGGVTVPLPANYTDPTPFDRHSYAAFIYSHTKRKAYLWCGANTSVGDTNPGVIDGTTPPEYLGDTWCFEFDTMEWRRCPTSHPFTVYEQCCVYDSFNERMILHGGSFTGAFREGEHTGFFDLNTETWQNANPPSKPSNRYAHSMVFDPVRRVTWMFGGGYGTHGNELWKYNGTTWSQVAQAGTWPTARSFCGMAYDTIHNIVLMYGGNNAGQLNDTWKLDPAVADSGSGNPWTQLTPVVNPTLPGSPPRSEDLEFDPIHNCFVLHLYGAIYLYRYSSVKQINLQETIGVTDGIRKDISKVLREVVSVPDSVPGTVTSLDVPLSVGEALPVGVAGKARVQRPVTVGVPLTRAQGIFTVDQLGLSGATAGQFRRLEYYEDGTMKWVLVDFLRSVAAGATDTGVHLTTGTGAFGGPDLASFTGDVLVDTGVARFTINANPFRLFTQVEIGGQLIFQTGLSEGITVVSGGVRYSSIYDINTAVTIEENGPVRCCIKAIGVLKSSASVALCPYMVRMHFTKGQRSVRMFLSLRNAKSTSPSTFTFDSMEVNFKMALGAGPQFSTATILNPTSDTLGPTETAYLFQAYSTKLGWAENNYPNAPMAQSAGTFTQRGVEVRKVAGTVYQALSGNAADYAMGWAQLRDTAGRGVTMGIRNMPAFWPSGFEMSGDGTASIQLFSKRNSKTGIKYAWGAYETREMLIEFHNTTVPDTAEFRYELDYPLEGRAPLDQYNESGVIYGEDHLVTEAEQAAWFVANSGTDPGIPNIEPQLWRYHNWSDGGGDNQSDLALRALIDWIRTGRGGYLIEGVRNSLYKADTSVRHSDGFRYLDNQIDPGDESGGLNSGAFNGRIFDFAHAHWFSIPIAYYLTGNELFKEAFTDYGEWKWALGDGGVPPNYYNPDLITSGGYGDMRIWSRYLRDFAILWEVTRDGLHYDKALSMVSTLLDSSDTPGSFEPGGRNRDRGYIWMDHGFGTTPRRVSHFMTTEQFPEALWHTYRMLKEHGNVRWKGVRDLLHGLADFVMNEFYFDVGTGLLQYGYLYSTQLDNVNNGITNPYWIDGFWPEPSARLLTFAYELTGNTAYLTREAKLFKGWVALGDEPRAPSNPENQRFMWMHTNLPTVGWSDLTPVTVTNLGGGSWQLDWTVPTGATAYQIRYSEKTIRAWLGFNQARVYTYLPTANVAWFAAAEAAVPIPNAGGTPQTYVVTGLDPVRVYQFAVRYQVGTPSTLVIATAADTVAVTDTVAKATTRTLLDPVTVTDRTVKATTKALAEAVTVTDVSSTMKVVVKTVGDTVTVADAVVKATTKALAEAVTVTERTAKALVRTLADAVTITDAVIKNKAATLAESITVAEGFTVLRISVPGEPRPPLNVPMTIQFDFGTPQFDTARIGVDKTTAVALSGSAFDVNELGV